MKHFFSCISLVMMMTGCIQTQSRNEDVSTPPIAVNETQNTTQIVSLLGKPLNELPLPEGIKEKREKQLAEAKADYEQHPDDVEKIIWYGRRSAYLGQFNEAIRIYSLGLDKYPDSYKLLRHRGHRFITIRKFDAAIEDLQKAAFYSRPFENETEPDGLPNKSNIPLSSTKFNIWYHLGLAYYLKGNYDKAISAFKQCLEFCDNEDLLVATSDWFYMTYRKIGNLSAAENLLKPIKKNMEIIENQTYHQRLLMYKRVYTDTYLLDKAQLSSPKEALEPNLAYGIGNWYACNGELDKAREILFRITIGPRWDSFGYIAAEIDLLSLKDL